MRAGEVSAILLRVRRMLVRIGLLSLAGLSLNVLIAWLCACLWRTAPTWSIVRNPHRPDPVAFFEYRTLGTESVVGSGRPGTHLSRAEAARGPVPIHASSKWWPDEAMDWGGSHFAIAAGWPWRSLSAWRTVDSIEVGDGLLFQDVFHWAIVIRDTDAARAWDGLPVMLPLKPMLPGMVLGTAFYTAAIAGVIASSRCVRRCVRAKRGLCARCAHDVTGLESCPECGSLLKQPDAFTPK